MNNKNARLLPWLLAVAMSIFALPAIAADEDGDGISDAVENSVGLDPSVAQGGMMMIQADGAFTRDRPTMVMDSAGNYHIAYAITDEGIEIDSSMPANTMQVAYMMLDADGNVLIDETQLLDTGLSLRVNTHLAVTSADTVVLVYTDRSAKDLYYIHIDPSADDQNGDAATPATIKAVSETMIDAGTWANLQVAVDSSNIIHAWGQDGQYMSFETDTTVVTASTNPWATASPNSNGHGNSVMALDGDGNVHVVFQDCTLNNCGVSYGMLDGADGSVLIEGTPLYNAGDLIDEPHASQYNLMIDSTGLVNIVWRDKRGTVDATSYCDYCGSGGITWFARIDPSLDDQDGSMADMSVIKVVDDVEIGTLLYFSAFMDANDTIHLFEHSHNGLDHMAINTDGEVLVPMYGLSNDATDGNGWTKAEPAGFVNGTIVWVASDTVDNDGGTTLMYAKLFDPSAVDAGGSASGGLLTYFEAFDESGLPSGVGVPSDGYNITMTGEYWRLVVTGVEVGGSATVTIDTGASLPEFWRVMKFNGADWIEYGASRVSDTAFAITIVDGGDGDADGVANGIIVDPVGLGTFDGATVQTSGGGGGGCTIGDGRQPFDPLFPTLLLIAGIYLIRRRQAN